MRSLSVDQSALAVYAAQRSADGVLTIMLVNKSASPLISSINLTGFNPQSTVAVYQYSPANLLAIEHPPDQPVNASGFTATVPASSITLYEVRAAGPTVSTFDLTVTKTGNGLVTSSPAGIDCGATCSASFINGVTMTLTASPAANLIAWGGACASFGATPTCTVTMDAAKLVSASFKDVGLVTGLPAALTFATQNIASTSAAQSITLRNTGTAALNIDSLTASGDFAVSNTCGAGLGAGGFCTLNVTFTPTARGARTGSLTIASDAPGSPHTVALSGTGVASNALICTLSAAPASVRRNGSSILTATCSPTATAYRWTGGTCAGTTAPTCTVTPAATTSYSVTGTNSFGNSTATTNVTVKAVDLTPILMLLLD